jgi:hypothetical protein
MAGAEGLEFRRLTDGEPVERFRQGRDKRLELFLQRDALARERDNVSRTFVLVDVANQDCPILGYFSVSMTALRRDKLGAEAPDVPFQQVPAALLGQLARDERAPPGTGATIFAAMLDHIRPIAEKIGCRGLALDATSDLVPYYEAFGLTALSGPATDGSRKMFARLDRITVQASAGTK